MSRALRLLAAVLSMILVALLVVVVLLWRGAPDGPSVPQDGSAAAPGSGIAPALENETAGPVPAAAPLAEPCLRSEAVPGGRATVCGRVLDVDTGAPVPGMEVRWTTIPPLIALVDGLKRTMLSRVKDIRRQYDLEMFDAVDGRTPAISDGAGRFTLNDVAARTFYLAARGGPYYQVAWEALRIEPSERLEGVEVKVRAGGRVVGNVFDTAGAPIADAELNLFYPLSPLSVVTLESAGTRRVRTRSREDGSYELPAVAAGRGYFLFAITPGRARVTRKGIAVERGADTHVDVVVPCGGVLTGRVSGPGGEPVAGAELRPIQLGKAFDMLLEGDSGVYDATTDAAGLYRISGLSAGDYRLFASAPGYAPAYRSGVLVREAQVTQHVDIVLRPGSFLAGHVVDAEGQPIAGAVVRAGGGRPLAPGEPAASFSASGRGIEVPRAQAPAVWLDEMTEEQRQAFRKEFLRSLGVLRAEGPSEEDGALRERPFDGQDYTYLVFRFQAISGADGTFSISGLPADEALWMWCHHDGYSDRVLRGAVPGTDDFEIVLAELGGFSGIVMGGDSGEPLGRFRIKAQNLMGFDEVELEIESADGRFTVAELNPGPYRYSVVADAYEKFDGGQVTVEGGAITRGQVVVLQPGASVSGWVLDGLDGSPLEGARVVPRREEGASLQNVQPRRHSAAISGADGSFRIVGLGTGDQHITASHPRRVATTVELPALAAGEVRTDVVIRMAAGGSIAGRALGPGDEPLAGLDVMAQSTDRTVLRQAVTGLDGSFLFEGLRAGPYAVMRLDLDLSDGDVHAMLPRILNGLHPVTATVKEGETTRVTLRVGEEEGVIQVEGFVLLRGAPLAGAFVTYVRVDAGAPGVGGLRSDRSDELGSYRITVFDPGSYVARVSGPPLDPGDVRLVVAVPAAERVRIDLAVPGAEISGRVVAAGAGLPLEGVRVNLEAEVRESASGFARFAQTSTGADGTFHFRRLAAGRYSVVARGLTLGDVTYGDTRRDGIALAAEQLQDLGDVRLGPGGTVRGLVVDAEERPVEGAALFFRTGDGLGGAIGDTLTDRQGAFERAGLAPGAYRVQARAFGFASAAADAQVEEGGVHDVKLVLARGGSARIYVTDAQGRPVTGARVEVQNAAGDVVSDLASAADVLGGYLAGDAGPGVTVVTGLAREEHMVTVSKEGHGTVTRRMLVDGDPTYLNVKLE